MVGIAISIIALFISVASIQSSSRQSIKNRVQNERFFQDSRKAIIEAEDVSKHSLLPSAPPSIIVRNTGDKYTEVAGFYLSGYFFATQMSGIDGKITDHKLKLPPGGVEVIQFNIQTIAEHLSGKRLEHGTGIWFVCGKPSDNICYTLPYHVVDSVNYASEQLSQGE